MSLLVFIFGLGVGMGLAVLAFLLCLWIDHAARRRKRRIIERLTGIREEAARGG